MHVQKVVRDHAVLVGKGRNNGHADVDGKDGLVLVFDGNDASQHLCEEEGRPVPPESFSGKLRFLAVIQSVQKSCVFKLCQVYLRQEVELSATGVDLFDELHDRGPGCTKKHSVEIEHF